jgi:hypothetical protein
MTLSEGSNESRLPQVWEVYVSKFAVVDDSTSGRVEKWPSSETIAPETFQKGGRKESVGGKKFKSQV